MGVKRNWLLVITKVVIDIALCIVVINSVKTFFVFTKGFHGIDYSISIPVRMANTLERYYPTHEVKDGRITMNAHFGTARVLTYNPFPQFLMIVGFVLNQLLVIAILYNLRKIFRMFYHHQPFDYKNVTSIKIIALYLSLIWIKDIIFNLITYSYYLKYELAYKFGWRWDFKIRGIVIAAIVYIVAEIFKYGFELKRENEEFV